VGVRVEGQGLQRFYKFYQLNNRQSSTLLFISLSVYRMKSIFLTKFKLVEFCNNPVHPRSKPTPPHCCFPRLRTTRVNTLSNILLLLHPGNASLLPSHPCSCMHSREIIHSCTVYTYNGICLNMQHSSVGIRIVE